MVALDGAGIGGDTPMMAAVRHRRSDVVAMLRRHGASPDNISQATGCSPIMIACMLGDADIVSALLGDDADIVCLSDNGLHSPSLVYACLGGSAAVVQMLLDRGSYVTEDSTSAWVHATPLGAAVWCRFPDIAEMLLLHGASHMQTVGSVFCDAMLSPIEFAASLGYADMVRCLLACGVSATAACRASNSPPLFACTTVDCARALVEYGADVNVQRCDDGATPVMLAAQGGHTDVVQYLCDCGADLSLVTELEGFTAAHVAAVSGATDALRVLLTAGADPNAADHTGNVPLVAACVAGHTPCVTLLCQWPGVRLNVTDVLGTPLCCMRAVLSRPDVLTELLLVEADVCCGGGGSARVDGLTPLHVAVRDSHNDAIPMLLQCGSSPDTPAERGFTPLMTACVVGNLAALELLLLADADPNAVNDDGLTALALTVHCGQVDAARHLLTLFDDVDVDRVALPAFATPLHTACSLDQRRIAELLIAARADVNAPAAHGVTPLFASASVGSDAIVHALFAAGASIDTPRSVDGATALAVAAEAGRESMVDLLCLLGANVNVRLYGCGATPLHLAAQNGHVGVAQVLHGYGACLDTRRHSDGATPLLLAVVHKHMRLAEFLCKQGAAVNIGRRVDGLHLENAVLTMVGAPPDGPGACTSSDSCSIMTPLWAACALNLTPTVQVLLAHGADTTITLWGVTPLDIASFKGFTLVAAAIVRFLLSTSSTQSQALVVQAVMNAKAAAREAAARDAAAPSQPS